MAEAIGYANRVKDKYREALGDEARFSRLLGVGLLGVATAIPIMAITEASTKAIGVAGIGGTGAFAQGAWLQSTPRQRAYLLGYNAVNCAVEAVRPLAIDRTGPSYMVFEAARKNINNQIAAVENAIGRLNSELAGNQNISAAQKSESTRLIADARTAVAEAKVAHRAGVELTVQLEKADDDLTLAVDDIIGQVDRVIVDNQLTLAALPGIIGNLGGIYSRFPGVPTATIGGFDPNQFASGLQKQGVAALAELSKAVAELGASTRDIADYIAAVTRTQPIEALKKCGVDPQAVATAMTIEPQTASFSGTRDETKPYLIHGGAFPYLVDLHGASTDRISVSQPDRFGRAFLVSVKSGAPVGQYLIYATDGTGRSATMNLTVAEASGESGKDEKGSQTSPTRDAFNRLSSEERTKVQRALCVTGDGAWGPNTATAFANYKTNSITDAEVIAELLQLTEDGIKARCPKGNEAAPVPSAEKVIIDLAGALKGQSFAPFQEQTDYVISVSAAEVASGKLSLTLAIKNTPTTEVTSMALKEAILKHGKKTLEHADLSKVTAAMIVIANEQALIDDKKLTAN